eukprot:m.295231 g.295231  ORF g.295231 m.295231 type:complete len:63 (-) comp55900_c0_seq1:3-191(-)
MPACVRVCLACVYGCQWVYLGDLPLSHSFIELACTDITNPNLPTPIVLLMPPLVATVLPKGC